MEDISKSKSHQEFYSTAKTDIKNIAVFDTF
jgi:hypothetical protein